MEKFFKLKEHGTKFSTEVVAGLTTFFTMAYIIVVNPSILSQSGMEWGAVFLATIISAIIGTLVMGLVANVPYAQAPGMGLNAFFVYTVCFGLGFSWQQALSMVFICGLVNILITVTKIRKFIIKAIPQGLQNAIGGGIGIFIAYIGLLNVGFVNFDAGVPGMSAINTPTLWLFLIGLVDTVWVVIADEQIRKRRIIARNNYSEQEAMQRIKAQMSDRMYISIADKIIYNNGSIEDLRALVWEVLRNEKEDSQ
jgi:AGZA family xanthine/uracil permease-like MFS transporter